MREQGEAAWDPNATRSALGLTGAATLCRPQLRTDRRVVEKTDDAPAAAVDR